MEKEKLSAEINKLSDLANKLHSFEEDPNAFLEVIKNLDRSYLEEEHANFKEYSTDSKNILKPVNFAKYIILDKILKNKDVKLSLLDEIKKKIEQKDVDYFKDYPDFKESILNQEDKKFFQSWKNFNILFYVFYDQYKDDVKSILTDIAEHLKENLNLKDAKSTINGFGWNNAFGTSDCWIALYPYTRKSHKDSYQIFMRVYANNRLIYGICNGSNLDEFKNLKEQKTNNLNIEDFEKFLFNEAKPLYDTKNNEIEGKLSKSKLETKEDITSEKIDKNFILYGPPGTGKTYQTYEKAVKIIDPDYNYDNRKELIKKFKDLQEKGLIKFVTFHQSYSYEEFIEGYRYNPSTKIPTPEAGIFKTLVDNAKAEYITPKKKIDPNFKTNDIYKMSLGDTLEGEEDIYEYCIENNVISLGYGLDIDYTNANTKEEISKLFREKYDLDEESDFNITAMNYFKNNMKENDLVFISKGNRNLRAIGKITGNYFFNPNSPIRFNHFRKVEWIFYDKVIPVERIMNKYFSQQTIYELNKNNLIQNFCSFQPFLIVS
jgi:flagellar biosynthesis GTPase FlhF